jgi:(2Fe-2S) ferredoxin
MAGMDIPHTEAHPNSHQPMRRVTLLLAKSAVASAPREEMSRYAAALARHPAAGTVEFAFTEQGEPSFFEVFRRLRSEGHEQILVLPLLLPLEPSFLAWLSRTLQRWRADWGEPWPQVRVSRAPADSQTVLKLLEEMLEQSPTCPQLQVEPVTPGGSVVPAQKRRVLICAGGPCNAVGATLLWGYFRNEQNRQGLRTAGDGLMSAKTSCLGPCNLAPVMQVLPEGTYYGGFTEQGIDRIITEHLLGGRVVEELAYTPTGKKAFLRSR